jgi:hypothetical protein
MAEDRLTGLSNKCSARVILVEFLPDIRNLCYIYCHSLEHPPRRQSCAARLARGREGDRIFYLDSL